MKEKQPHVSINKDTISDDNLIPIKMYKMLFPGTQIANLSKSIDEKVVICAYNSCIL